MSYVRPAIEHGSEKWCLKESEMEILRTEAFVVGEMYGVQVKDRKRSTDLMLMLGLSEAVDQLAMAKSVRWYGHVLRRAFDLETEGQGKKGRPKRPKRA